jgi:hypothetical protein
MRQAIVVQLIPSLNSKESNTECNNFFDDLNALTILTTTFYSGPCHMYSTVQRIAKDESHYAPRKCLSSDETMSSAKHASMSDIYDGQLHQTNDTSLCACLLDRGGHSYNDALEHSSMYLAHHCGVDKRVTKLIVARISNSAAKMVSNARLRGFEQPISSLSEAGDADMWPCESKMQHLLLPCIKATPYYAVCPDGH